MVSYAKRLYDLYSILFAPQKKKKKSAVMRK